MNIFEAVEQFNKEVIGIKRDHIQVLPADEKFWLQKAIHEEIVTELEEADNDIVKQADAIGDAIYFLIGGFVRMGISASAIESILMSIHECNMQKKGGVKLEREVHHKLDAVKPDSWKGPESAIDAILKS